MKMAFYIAKYGTWLDKAIALYDKGPYSHCELVFSDGMFFSCSPRDRGTRFKKIELDNHWVTVDLHFSANQELQIRDWCSERVGFKYDFVGVFGFIIPIVRQDKDKWFCSEICCSAIQTEGLLPRVKARSLTPNELYFELNG